MARAKRDIPPLYMYIAADFALGEKQMNDRTVILPFGVCPDGNLYFAPNPFAGRVNSHVIIDEMIKRMKQYRPMALILEGGHIQKGLHPTLIERSRKERCDTTIHAPHPTNDKVARFRGFQALLQQGRVFFPETPFFLTDLLPELYSFPTGRHDDFPDACAYAAYSINELALPLPPKAGEPTRNADIEGTYDWHQKRIEAANNRAREEGESKGPSGWAKGRKGGAKPPKQSVANARRS